MRSRESHPRNPSRRRALLVASAGVLSAALQRKSVAEQIQQVSSDDRSRIRELAAWTAQSFDTPNPIPFGAAIYETATGALLTRSLNVVGPEHDPSAHAEVHTIRQACSKLQAWSLRGCTLYTTCEPCPMCMSCALWAGLDRVVYGATIADAARFGHQIMIPAAEVARR